MHGNRRLCSFLACLNESSGRAIVVTLSLATASDWMFRVKFISEMYPLINRSTKKILFHS